MGDYYISVDPGIPDKDFGVGLLVRRNDSGIITVLKEWKCMPIRSKENPTMCDNPNCIVHGKTMAQDINQMHASITRTVLDNLPFKAPQYFVVDDDQKYQDAMTKVRSLTHERNELRQVATDRCHTIAKLTRERNKMAQENSGLRSQELESQQQISQMSQEYRDLMDAYKALLESQRHLIRSLE